MGESSIGGHVGVVRCSREWKSVEIPRTDGSGNKKILVPKASGGIGQAVDAKNSQKTEEE